MKKIIVLLLVSCSFLLAAKGFIASKDEHDMICGLKPYQYPRWMSEIELKNDKRLHFVSTKCMMLFYYKNSKWHDLGVDDKEPIRALRVQDYNTLEVLDAKKAFYVFGSKIIGPKGDDLVPFKTKEDAKHFIDINGGTRILEFKDFKLNLFDFLNI